MTGDNQQTHGAAPVAIPATACVFCGSSAGAHPEFADAARRLGAALAGAGIGLVYGGGNVGLMGEVAHSVLDHGGHVAGIIPEFLVRRERVLAEVQETIVVPDMHTRKRLMYERAGAFIAMPGGIGTLEELVEQMTWAQLGAHDRPIVLLNTLGFWTPLLDLLQHMRRLQFIRPNLDVTFTVVDEPEHVVPLLRAAMAQAASDSDARRDAPPDADRPAAPGPF